MTRNNKKLIYTYICKHHATSIIYLREVDIHIRPKGSCVTEKPMCVPQEGLHPRTQKTCLMAITTSRELKDGHYFD